MTTMDWQRVSVLCDAVVTLDGALNIRVQIPPGVPISSVVVTDDESGTVLLEGSYKPESEEVE
jgi:hypothetical protein